MIEEETVATEVTAEPAPEVEEAPKEETVGEVLNVAVEPATETVSLAKHLKEKNARKVAETKAAELEAELARLNSDTTRTKTQVSTDLDGLAEEYGVDISFLEKLSSALEAKTEAKLQPLREKEQKDKIESAFTTAFDRTMADMPEYAQVVNRSVIKTLSLDPANANKTFAQIIEDAYGHTIVGKKTLERTVSRGGNTSGELDYNRAKSDNDYFTEVMADPVLKKQYNDRLFQES